MPSDPMPRTRKRRGRGEASVYQRKDGLWCGSVSLGLKPNGKRLRKDMYEKTKALALEAMRKIQAEHDAGRLIDAEALTVGEYLKRWLAASKDRTSEGTHIRYAQLAEQYLIPALGPMKLSKLRPVHVETTYSNLSRTTAGGKVPASLATRKAAGVVLCIALRRAVKLGVIASNPGAEVSKPKPVASEMHFLMPLQAKRFLEASSGHAIYSVALGTGLRLGELLALRWSDIDLEKATFEVRRSVSQVGKRFVEKLPKSKSGKRTVTLPAMVIAVLRSHRKAMATAGLLAGPVFSTSRGTFQNRTNVRRQFNAIIAKTNANAEDGERIPSGLRLHDLRHTHASCLIASGAWVKAVSRRLGHADITITLKTYAHVMPDDDAKLAATTDGIFG